MSTDDLVFSLLFWNWQIAKYECSLMIAEVEQLLEPEEREILNQNATPNLGKISTVCREFLVQIHFFSFFLILLFPIYAHITPVFCLLLLLASNSENFCWNTYYFLELFSSKVQFVDWENNSWLSSYCTSIIQAKWKPLQTLALSMQIRYMDMLLDGGLDIDSVDKVCRYLYFVSSMIYSSFLSLSL